MDSSASAARGKGRAFVRKRPASYVDHEAHQSSSSGTITAAEPIDQITFGTPAANIGSSPFSFETPSPSASRRTRDLAHVYDDTVPSLDDHDSKGGRSLRKRPRVNYTFDHVDEDTDNNKESSRTLKKRAFAYDLDTNEQLGSLTKRRSFEQIQPTSSAVRRRYQPQVRKSTMEPQVTISDQHMEDVEVQDTIEVGGHHSEQSDESTLRRTSSNTSCGSSNHDSRPSQITASFGSIPSPRPFGFGVVAMDSSDDNLQHRAEQPKLAHTSLPDAPSNLAEELHHTSYEHLTPYVEGVFVDWKPSTQPDAELYAELYAAEDLVEYQVGGAQPSSTTPGDGTMEDTPAASTRANSVAADAELPTRKPASFKKTRDASQFIGLFENYKSLRPEEIWERLAVVNNAMVAYQNEFNELRKLTDDEDNAARYRHEDQQFEQRLKMVTSKDPEANPKRKDFVVKGIRAERPDPEIAYARHQDKLMANNYLFEYDDRESMIGRQKPSEQKTGAGKGRLRDRPKQTAKAAECDDPNVVLGKRARKPPALYDGSEAPSRGSSPVPTQRRRRQAKPVAEDNSEIKLAAPALANRPIEQQTPKKKGKGGRPRKHPLPVPIAEDPPAAAEEMQQQPEQPEQIDAEEPPRKRRRRRTAIESAEPAEVVEAVVAVEAVKAIEEEEAPATNGANRYAPAKVGLRHTNSQLSEVPSGSFYTSSMQSTNAEEGDDSRPLTSSSIATQSTGASNNYKLREKRQKKFSLNPDNQIDDEEPKPKRIKRSRKTRVEDFTSIPVPVSTTSLPIPVQQTVIEQLSTPKAPPKIKLKNYHPPGHASLPPPTSIPTQNPFSLPSSSDSTPPQGSNGITNGLNNNDLNNGGTNGTDLDDTKEYNQMTKSEKMSHSMKARWASGSMSQAVAKRRATLANKKQAVRVPESGQPLEMVPVIMPS